MKGMVTTFCCALCGKRAEKETAKGESIGLPQGWVTRDANTVRSETAQLYSGWQGTQGPDILPRLFCSKNHLDAYVMVENASAKAARAEAQEIARQRFEEIMRPAKLKAMDAVTALATAVQGGGGGDDDGS